MPIFRSFSQPAPSGGGIAPNLPLGLRGKIGVPGPGRPGITRFHPLERGLGVGLDLTGTTYTKVMSDTLDLTEQLIYWNRRARQQSDTFVITDDPNRTIQMIMNDFGLDMTDAETDTLRFVRVPSETISLTDAEIDWLRIKRVMDDPATLADSFVKSVTGSGAILYTKVLTETLTLFDEMLDRSIYRRRQDDALIFSDSATPLLAAGIFGPPAVIAKVVRYVGVLP